MAHWEYRKINLNDAPRKSDDIDLLTDAGEWLRAHHHHTQQHRLPETPTRRSRVRESSTPQSCRVECWRQVGRTRVRCQARLA
jgi:hypothetical protein